MDVQHPAEADAAPKRRASSTAPCESAQRRVDLPAGELRVGARP
jgi:hypothetical protein